MTGLVAEVYGQLREQARVDPSALAMRVDALARFRRATDRYLPTDWLEPVRSVTERVSGRLALSRALTVVAIAGPTGSGKSSMFNALAGMELSPVGVRRPTTGAAYACVWGTAEEAEPLLDRLGVLPSRRFARHSDLMPAQPADPLAGLILLDLPDFDSIEREHAAEVDRLLSLVDLVLWVVDPQKYADQALHERQLRPLRRYRDVMVVALNQTDLLTPEQTGQVLADLRRLLEADGLAGIRTVATSTVTGPTGVADLRATLEQAVQEKRAALRRLAADLDEVVAGLSDLAGPELLGSVEPDRPLVDGLAAAAGLAGVAEAASWSYRRRAAAVMGWPVPRPRPAQPVLAPPQRATQQAAISLAARQFAERCGRGLPLPWPVAVTDASRSRLDEVPEALARAVANTMAAEHARTPWWWRLVAVGLWTATGVAGLGLVWLVLGWLARLVSLPVIQPGTGLRLLIAGVVAGVALAGLSRPLVWWASRHAQLRVAAELRAAVAEVARAYVVEPVRQVREAYATARSALRAAAGD